MQSIDDVMLTFLGRNHTSKDVLDALKNAQHFSDASVDIIFACAYNNLKDWFKDNSITLFLNAVHCIN